jgi:hypothetical protein
MTVAWQGYTPADLAPSRGKLTPKVQKQANAQEAEHQTVLKVLTLVQNVVHDLECRLDLGKTWTPDDTEYCEALEYITHQTFFHAVETLEGLVVGCLFELAKANLIGTSE